MTAMSRFHRVRRAARRGAPPHIRYTQGFCGEFALAAAALTGLPTVVLYSRGDKIGIHAMVWDKERGLFYDVNGWQTWRQVQHAWRWFGPAAFRPRGIGAWGFEPGEVERAKAYIRRYRRTPENTPR